MRGRFWHRLSDKTASFRSSLIIGNKDNVTKVDSIKNDEEKDPSIEIVDNFDDEAFYAEAISFENLSVEEFLEKIKQNDPYIIAHLGEWMLLYQNALQIAWATKQTELFNHVCAELLKKRIEVKTFFAADREVSMAIFDLCLSPQFSLDPFVWYFKKNELPKDNTLLALLTEKAIQNKRLDILKYLKKNNQILFSNASIPLAETLNEPNVLSWVIKNVSNPEIKKENLKDAIAKGKLELVKNLLSALLKKKDILPGNSNDETALQLYDYRFQIIQIAAIENQLEILKYLAQTLRYSFSQIKQATLAIAAKTGNQEIVRWLLDRQFQESNTEIDNETFILIFPYLGGSLKDFLQLYNTPEIKSDLKNYLEENPKLKSILTPELKSWLEEGNPILVFGFFAEGMQDECKSGFRQNYSFTFEIKGSERSPALHITLTNELPSSDKHNILIKLMTHISQTTANKKIKINDAFITSDNILKIKPSTETLDPVVQILSDLGLKDITPEITPETSNTKTY